jgi:hypothetical protein
MKPHKPGPQPQVGGDGNAGTAFLFLLIGAAVAGAGVWYLMRERGTPEPFQPIKNLATGDVACLPESAAASALEGAVTG